ncbi:nicotinate-nucleotide adenylyltransferase [Oleiagrimonas sp.]|jgi:nicotinate-nucleotide adenylyltransferase|uniref:nicotinate-nucleotide adenylyltransferase n=1 Tax=Oleiagrimonas sp. TaxID=2010330 RepID=UPI002625E7E0|nr:nicotinate-nucleotide adenylyltransferase [Oleiagrimonas sp.]MDA3914783.1 nicotinate-nucleotide adenylyltransferase [Oleiagrimonas sp.]
MSRQRLVLFGGTFDPVHIGHLRVALEASEFLQAPVRMIPAREPPHRAPTRAGADQRAALLRAALKGQDRLQLDTRELGRDGPSYSVDTLRDLRDEVGPEPAVVLLIGADAFAGLDRWHRWREMFELAHIGVLTRPGNNGAASPDLQTAIAGRKVKDAAALWEQASGGVVDIPVTALDISASQVRELLATGRCVRYLLPEPLIESPDLLAVYRD